MLLAYVFNRQQPRPPRFSEAVPACPPDMLRAKFAPFLFSGPPPPSFKWGHHVDISVYDVYIAASNRDRH